MGARSTPCSQAGFSLMEAIVAVAILGAASVPLLYLQSQNARSVMRLETQATRITAEQVAAKYLSIIDLTVSQTGMIELGGGWTLTWQADPMSEAANAVMGVGGQSRYAAQLVRISAIGRNDEGREFAIEVYRTAVQETFPYRAL